ncbi:MAG: DUF479 domain-containing protein [Chitinophagaceae bacterium]|nr:DUF479 domain-containing protein [Chitinophagaceae bacterium]
MNYLAHAYLSFREPDVLAGNMISDFVKGKKKLDYPPGVQVGIQLHRYIDHFTDNHASTKNIASIFRPYYRLYSGAFADVVYDHFLANDRSEMTTDELESFSRWVYSTIDPYLPQLPSTFQQMFPYMKSQNWLYNYRLETGMANSFAGLVRRAKFIHESETAFNLFLQHYKLIEENYQHFIPEIKTFAYSTMKKLQQQSS